MIPGHKRKRDPSDDLSDLKATQSLSKKVKQEVKKEEPEDAVMIRESNRRLRELYPRLAQLHEFPPSWPNSIKQRLRDIPLPDSRFVPDNPDMHRKFVRLEFSKAYGGPSVALQGTWARKSEVADDDMPGLGPPRMQWPTQDFNFFLPLVPCAPGLMFHSPGFIDGLDIDPNNPEPRSVFVRIEPNAWLYVGEYRIRLGVQLEEWKDLSDKQRKLWKKHVDKLPGVTKRNKMRGKDLQDALDNGTRMLEVSTMECVGYHKGIQEAICRLPSTV